MVQLREKEAQGGEYLRKALQVKEITDRYEIPLIIDDRVDVALACGAAGVHVGAADLPVASVRRLLGPEKILGATAKTEEAALQAWKDGADYLGVGAIFPSVTKAGAIPTSVPVLEQICQAVPIPVAAIGGLTLENIDVLAGTSIQGIAVVSAVMKAKNPRAAAQGLRKKLGDLIPRIQP